MKFYDLLHKFINNTNKRNSTNDEIYYSNVKLNPRITYFKNTKKIITIRFDRESDFTRFISNIKNVNKFEYTTLIVDDDFYHSRYLLIGDTWTKIWGEGDKGQSNDEFEIELIKSLSKSDEVVIGYYDDYISYN